MKLEIRTPDKSVFTGEATLVQLPGIDGLFDTRTPCPVGGRFAERTGQNSGHGQQYPIL